jgi:hypothetical protein
MFFCGKVKIILKLPSYIKIRKKEKITERCLSGSRLWRHAAAVGGVPLPLLGNSSWIGASPMAAGKSPIAGSVDPTRWSAVVVAMNAITIFTFIFKLRILHHAGSGWGTTSAPDP